MKSMLDDEKVSSSLDSSTKDNMNSEIDKMINWLQINENCDKDVYNEKLKEFQDIMKPLLSNNSEGNNPDQKSDMPNIEEID